MPTIKMLQNWRDFQSGEVTDALNEVVCAAWVDAGIAEYRTAEPAPEVEVFGDESAEISVPHRGPGRPRVNA